jgi:type IV pilus assembly protein PilY1
MMNRWTVLAAALSALLTCTFSLKADDTDLYVDPVVPNGAEPLVMFTLDYRPNLAATVCGGNECDQLIAEGYLPATGPYNFFQLLRAVLMRVLDPLEGVRIGFMMSHDDSCSGAVTGGPSATQCSNGAYVLYGFQPMSAGTDDPGTFQTTGEDPNKLALIDKLAALPIPQGTLSHPFQGKELYFELFRYLTGQGIYNGHVGYEDLGDTDKDSNLDVDFPSASWDTSVEDAPGTNYISPLAGLPGCAPKVFVVNLMFQVSNQEDDSDSAITAAKADGGMAGINLKGANNTFDTVVGYLKDVDLGDGSFGTMPDLDGDQNVTSYFIVDPTNINQTTIDYATAGGTGTALPLSTDPEELTNTLRNVFKSILSVSTTFVAPSVPVNVFNRSQIVNEVFFALFEPDPDGFPLWNGNLKKLRIGKNAITGKAELQDASGVGAIDIDGRIKRDAVTYWTVPGSLPAPADDEVAGADGRAVPRGGTGQKIPGYLSGSPELDNDTLGSRRLYTVDPDGSGLVALNADANTAALLWPLLTRDWAPAPSAATYAGAKPAERGLALNILRFARGLQDDGATVRPWLLGAPLHSRPRPVNYGATGAGYDQDNPDIRILMGTNDGFMHMFRNTSPAGGQDGGEAWAFMPPEALPALDRLRTNAAGTPIHPSTMDGSPVSYTLDSNGDGSIRSADGDKAYTFFGLRRGGKSYFGLDISDPDAPSHLWTISKGAAGSDFAELGQTWSTPQLGRLRVNGVVMPVLVFGGGYNGDDGGDNVPDLGKDAKNRATNQGLTPASGVNDDEGNAVYIVNAETGDLIWKVAKGATQGYDGSLAYLHPEMHDSIPGNRSPPLEILTENQYRIHSADACQLAQLIRIGWSTGSL